MPRGGKEESRFDLPMGGAADAPQRAHEDTDVDGYRDACQATQLDIHEAIDEGFCLVIANGIAEAIYIGIAIRTCQGTPVDSTFGAHQVIPVGVAMDRAMDIRAGQSVIEGTRPDRS
ncbi:hypothetical protein [Streptomyces sp. NPDC093589]|uniref:hypothetical protein n=1 Tax=Streptomyces sp. NPDC093589 TaxID=3366043 RepID=UPI00380571C0